MPSSQILPGLYVGDEIAAIAPEVHTFQCVLNIAEEVPRSSLLEDGVTFERFSILDVGGEDEQDHMFGFFSKTCLMIHQALQSGRPVLVHCAEGKQSSCTVIVAYLVAALGYSLLHAKAYVLERHLQAFDFDTGVHFEPALERWEEYVKTSAVPIMEDAGGRGILAAAAAAE